MTPKTEIIAEIGVNHDGSLAKAIQLADAAIDAGADIVKTQASYPSEETSEYAAPDHLEMIEGLILDMNGIEELALHVRSRGVEFMCTPAERHSLNDLVTRGLIQRIKIASDAVTDHAFLKVAAQYYLPVIFSTGMADIAEVVDAFHVLNGTLPREMITIMQCTTCYPCPLDQVNLRVIQTYKNALDVRVGFSDHTTSLVLPAVAIGMGASIIEKHFTLQQDDPGPDHAASLEPHQFKQMIEMVRQAERALGDGIKVRMSCEEGNARFVRKSLAARIDIAEGDWLTSHNTTALRPATGIPIECASLYYGRQVSRSYRAGELIDR